MAKDCLPPVGLLLGLITPFGCYGLGLGEVALHSALNQPLSADVEVIDLDRTVPSDELTFKIPNEEPPVNDLQVKWQQKGGKFYAHLSTKTPIDSPYFNFELAMDWSNGHMVRAYTLLLDPPKTDPLSLKPVKKKVPVPATEKEPVVPKTTIPHHDEFIYETQEGEGLYRLAMKLRPNDSVSVFKMMDEIYAANPDAFLNHDRNKLSKHYRLHIPQLGGAKITHVENPVVLSVQTPEPVKKKLNDEFVVTKDAFDAMSRQNQIIQNEITAMTSELDALHHQFVQQQSSIEHLQAMVVQFNKLETMTTTRSKPLFNKELLLPTVDVITKNRLMITVGFIGTGCLMLLWSIFTRRPIETPEQKIEEAIKEEVSQDPLFEETEATAVATFSDETLADYDEAPIEAIAIQKYSGHGIDNYFSSLLILDEEEINTKLKLAKAYVDMGDVSGARDLLDEVVVEGNRQQQQEAQALIKAIS